jgi:peptidoglycan-associated lipoprotein
MKKFRLVILAAAAFLAACADGGLGGLGGGSDRQDAGGLGSASDPASPAYFQQAVGDRVFFEVDQSTLSAAGRATLDGQAQWLLDNPDYAAIIEGHADERGTTEYNIALGARRASAVQEYLFAQGVALNRLQTVSFGKERPVEICSDEVCYAQNRRSVTVLQAAAGV